MTTHPAKIGKVTGPPGTGKTTYLLSLVAAACKRYDPERIGAVSYTNAAVETIKERIAMASNIDLGESGNVRTLHSHCFRLLEMKKERVAESHFKQWNEEMPHRKLPLDKTKPNEDEAHENGIAIMDSSIPKDNAKIFQRVNKYRNDMTPMEKWDVLAVDFWKDWNDWCELNGYTDFTGILEQAYQDELVPDVDILMIDEAQDLTKIQLHILNRWAQDATSTLFVGDSDQAIYRWAGAAPEVFAGLEHQWAKLLDQSYRVPRAAHEYAMQIIAQANDREQVTYKPTDEQGRVLRNLMVPDLSLEGTHMLLGRCGFHLNRWKNWLINNGIAWHNPYRETSLDWNPTNTKIWRAIRIYSGLLEGKMVRAAEIKKMIREMQVNGNLIHGIKGRVSDLKIPDNVSIFDLSNLGLFTDEFLRFDKEIVDVFHLKGVAAKLIPNMQEEDIPKTPRLTMGTIHSVKGGEADHVWIDLGTSSQCMRAAATNPQAWNDEVRVAYVAATRCRHTLGLLNANGLRSPVFC